MSFTDIKGEFEDSCRAAGRRATAAFKKRVIELIAGLSFADKFEGMIMGMGGWAFHDKDNQATIPVVYQDGEHSLVEWCDAIDCAVERRKVYDLVKKPGFKDIVSLQEISRILTICTDGEFLQVFDITKEEVNAYIEANRKLPRARVPRGRKGDSEVGPSPLARSLRQSALR